MATRAFSVVIIAVGLTIVGLTIARGGGPLATGVIMGLLFTALGAGRLYVATRK
jgi:hypothetical protein